MNQFNEEQFQEQYQNRINLESISCKNLKANRFKFKIQHPESIHESINGVSIYKI